jgi:DNA primase
MWEESNVSLTTQRFFELSFDPCSNSIAIPIRDELGTLIAVKARRLEYNPNLGESKYFFLEPGAKSQVLYGLYQNLKLIQLQGIVYVGESERFVHQLYEMGYYGVSTGGSKVSKRQIEMLTRLGVKICFCFDEDISEEELRNIVEGFMDGIPIYAMIDRDNILDKKESPSDNPQKWQHLVKNNIYKIKGGDSNE